MPLIYIPYRRSGDHTLYPLQLAVCWFPSRFYTNSSGALSYHSDSYNELPPGCNDGVPGKWLTAYIFVPPLALFPTWEEARAMLDLHHATR